MVEERWPLLSLDNFNAPENFHSRYILTSPVSLRACARLGIKPLELLPKSFSDFRLSFNEDTLSKLQEAYAQYELQRRNKLDIAHRLRARMKEIEKGLPWQPDSVVTATTVPPTLPSLGERKGRCDGAVRGGGRGVGFSLYCYSSSPSMSRAFASAAQTGDDDDALEAAASKGSRPSETTTSKKFPRCPTHCRRPANKMKAKSQISEDITGGLAQSRGSGTSGRTSNLSPSQPHRSRRSKMKSESRVKKDEAMERRDTFHKQLQERLEALESINEYVHSEKKEKMEARHKRVELHKELVSRLKEQKMKDKFLHEELKKKCQKLNVQHLEDQEYFRKHVLNKQREEMETLAANKRHVLTRQRAEGAMRKNQKKRAQFEQNRLHQELHNAVDRLSRQEEMRKRQQKAQERLRLEKCTRDTRIRDMIELRGRRSQQCRLTAQCIEQSLQRWREEVDSRQLAAAQAAQQAVQKSVEKKQVYASQMSEDRRREHAVNIAKLTEKHRERMGNYQREVDQWQRDRLELSRRKQVEADKRNAIVSCSSMLRSMIKDQESFANKSRIAEDRARLENTHCRNQTRDNLSWSIR